MPDCVTHVSGSSIKFMALWHMGQGIFMRDQETEESLCTANFEDRLTQGWTTQVPEQADSSDVTGRDPGEHQ